MSKVASAFGSVTTTKRPVSDIDILVVCEQDADCAKVRSALADVCAEYPIHLLLMTRAEEAEVNFIRGEHAIEIVR
jgi:predicted nucleotidyltransferase